MKSEVCNEAFTVQDLDQILAQLTDRGAELMLFLRHVMRLEVLQVSKDGATATLLDVSTVNEDSVRQAREPLSLFTGVETADLIARLAAEPDGGPRSLYDHIIRIGIAGSVRRETWRISSGLYCDPDGDVVGAARAMLRHGGKSCALGRRGDAASVLAR